MLAPASIKPAVAELVAIVAQAIPLGLAVLDSYVESRDAIDLGKMTTENGVFSRPSGQSRISERLRQCR